MDAKPLTKIQRERLTGLIAFGGTTSGRGAAPTLTALRQRGLLSISWASMREWVYTVTPAGYALVGMDKPGPDQAKRLAKALGLKADELTQDSA